MAHLKSYLQQLEQDFTIDTAKLKYVTNHFVKELEKGLSVKGGSIPMIPTRVMNYPTGEEKGKYLVLDLGGTNIRVYSIELTGEKSGFKIDQVQHKLPNELKTGNADQLWDFVTEILESFLQKAGFDLNVTTDLTYLNSDTAIGCVFGTGCNGAYIERSPAIHKLASENLPANSLMAINCEWGAFDNEHAVLPLTSFDIAIDEASPRKGQQAFEKMVAGLYLGELFRLIMLDVHKQNPETFFKGQKVEKLQEPYFMDSSFLSAIEEDTSDHLKDALDMSVSTLGVSPTYEELKFMKEVATLITTRAARLSASGVGAICKKRDLVKCHVGVEGSLFEKHPHFKRELSKALGEILDWDDMPKSSKENVEFMLSPGSGVGAAVIASTLKRN
ncbi:Hexokinase [Fusarium acuminatum]|uniref:Phosphotransferase n=1 Tax=Fusarium acuminatum TaxID=5515 RepID=A0ABZ2WYV6_9HYPO